MGRRYHQIPHQGQVTAPSPVIDCYDVSYPSCGASSASWDAETISSTLKETYATLKRDKKPVIHSKPECRWR